MCTASGVGWNAHNPCHRLDSRLQTSSIRSLATLGALAGRVSNGLASTVSGHPRRVPRKCRTRSRSQLKPRHGLHLRNACFRPAAALQLTWTDVHIFDGPPAGRYPDVRGTLVIRFPETRRIAGNNTTVCRKLQRHQSVVNDPIVALDSSTARRLVATSHIHTTRIAWSGRNGPLDSSL